MHCLFTNYEFIFLFSIILLEFNLQFNNNYCSTITREIVHMHTHMAYGLGQCLWIWIHICTNTSVYIYRFILLKFKHSKNFNVCSCKNSHQYDISMKTSQIFLVFIMIGGNDCYLSNCTQLICKTLSHVWHTLDQR